MSQQVEHEHVHTFVPNVGSRALVKTLKLGLFAVGVGLLGSFIFDRHHHTCSNCNNRWSHLGAFNIDDLAAHTCVRCGTKQWTKEF